MRTKKGKSKKTSSSKMGEMRQGGMPMKQSMSMSPRKASKSKRPKIGY